MAIKTLSVDLVANTRQQVNDDGRPSNAALEVYNPSSTITIYWGGDDVTTANGIPILPLESRPFNLTDGDDLYLVSGTNVSVRVGKGGI